MFQQVRFLKKKNSEQNIYLLIRCQIADYLFLHTDSIHHYSAYENTHIIHINKHVGGGSDDHFTSVPAFLFDDSVCESAHIRA